MKKVVVGISGGVDSAVAAILLKEAGYEVIGVTFLFTEDASSEDAVSVCKKLNIEHHILDYRSVFKEEVIDKFISDYNSGITPNPCVLCNRKIKFQYLYDAMINYNADYFATGHYAKVVDGRLYKSEDKNKDQTYFLSNVTKEQLARVLFPLEGISKDVVREIATKYDLSVATKKDSTDVCFINAGFKAFIENNSDSKKGPVIDVLSNEVIGTHDGLNKYTIGQRKGLNIGGKSDRMYVVGKDIVKNILYIALGENNDYLLSKSCVVKNINVFGTDKFQHCTAKFRYRQEEVCVTLEWLNDESAIVKYDSGVKAVTPGQACVFYLGEECLGGGIIESVNMNV